MLVYLRTNLSLRNESNNDKKVYKFISQPFLFGLNKIFQFLRNYRTEVIVGLLVFLFLLFRDVIKSFL